MNKLCTIDESGAQFTVFQSEIAGLREMAQEDYGIALEQLPIGKAASLLRALAAAAEMKRLFPGTEFPDKDEELTPEEAQKVETVETTFLQPFDAALMESLKSTGRLVINVIANDDRDNFEADPVESYEILSQARINAQNVIDGLTPQAE